MRTRAYRRFGRVPAIALAAAASAASVGGQELDCRPFASVSAPVLDPDTPPEASLRGERYLGWSHAFERETNGVGVLSPADAPNAAPARDWLSEISLPLWGNPVIVGGAWMNRGWWLGPHVDSTPRVLTYRGMLEVGYEEAGIVVLEARPDGWLRVWVDIGPEGRSASSGHMWTHECALDLGSTALELVLWEDRFLGPGAPPLSFLGEERHALRQSPRRSGKLIAWLDPDDEVELVELRGDWARVRAFRPGVFLSGCLGEDWEGEELVGWIRWRSPEAGSWLWYPTRGC